MKITNKITAIIVSVIVACLPVVSMATPQTSVAYTTSSDGSLPATYSGNVDDIISLKNPQYLISSSTSKSYVISAVAKTDSVISVYSLNTETGKYDKVYTDDGVLMQSTVGASGLYAQSVNLNNGKNSFMIVASKDSNTEVIKFEITLNQSIIAKILNIGSDLSQLFTR